MKVALAILRADPARGGAERYTADLAAALAQRGHDVSVLCHEPPPAPLPQPRCVSLGRPAATRLGRYLRLIDALDAHLTDVRYDVVHAMLPVRQCDVYHPHAGIAAESVRSGHLGRDGRVRQMASQLANRLDRKRQRFAAVERDLLESQRPPVVVCLSGMIRSDVRRCYPQLDESRLVTLLNGTDLGRFDPAQYPSARQEIRQRFGVGSDAIVALMIAQDFARKGLAQAIDAVAQVGDPRLVLLVAGRPDPSAYRARAQAAGIARQVVFAGPTQAPAAFYAAADFFVLPTRHDPCSLVVLEALAMGLPVISTAQNGATEVMADGAHGYVLDDPADVSGLADAMRQLLEPVRRSAMARACLELRPRLSHAHHVDALLDVYVQAVGRR